MATNPEMTPTQRFAMGSIFVAFGLFELVHVLRSAPVQPISVATAAAFMVMGFIVYSIRSIPGGAGAARSGIDPRFALTYLLTSLLCALLAFVFGSIALHQGPEQFGGGMSILGIRIGGSGERSGRILFGLGGVLFVLATAGFGVKSLKSRLAGRGE